MSEIQEPAVGGPAGLTPAVGGPAMGGSTDLTPAVGGPADLTPAGFAPGTDAAVPGTSAPETTAAVPGAATPSDPTPLVPVLDAGAAPLAADVSLLALVDRLAALLERSDLTELEVEAGGTGITLRKAAALGAPAVAVAAEANPATPAEAPANAGANPGASAPAAATGEVPGVTRSAVLAPLTGIFYASPSPGSPPFVVAGAEVVVGQVIGLIEAMKLFNEIKSDKAGRVVRVVAENGALVKAKHPLLEVEPL